MTAHVSAAGKQPTTAKWNTNVNVESLGRYLQLDNNQRKEVTDICTYFNEQMTYATSSTKNQEARIRQAVYGNLKLMKQTLTKKQYAEYVRLLNITLKNKGIEVK